MFIWCQWEVQGHYVDFSLCLELINLCFRQTAQRCKGCTLGNVLDLQNINAMFDNRMYVLNLILNKQNKAKKTHL